MRYDITFKGGISNRVTAYTPVEVLLELEAIGDEYNFEAQLWAEECAVGDRYEDDFCEIVAGFDSRFC